MAMTNEASVEIERPIHDVFEYTINNVAEWSHTVVEDVPVNTISGGDVGSTSRCATADRGQRMEFEGTVTKHEPPTASAVELIGDQFNIDVLYPFEDLGGRTRVTQVSVVTPRKFFLRVIFSCFGRMLANASCKVAEQELLSLKAKMENAGDH